MATVDGKVLVIIPPRGFPGEPLLVLLERLRAHGEPFEVVSRRPGPCVGGGEVFVHAARGWDEVEVGEPLAVVVLDDARGTAAAAEPVRRLLANVHAAGRVVGAIGQGVRALAAAGVARGQEVTAPVALEAELARAGAVILRARVASSGPLLTALDEGAGALAEALFRFRGLRGGTAPRPPLP